MTFILNQSLDAGLEYIRSRADEIYVCTAEPGTFAAIAGVALGSTSVVSGPIVNGTTGREFTATPGTADTYDSGGSASHWALVESGTSTLLATKAFDQPLTVIVGELIRFPPFPINISPNDT